MYLTKTSTQLAAEEQKHLSNQSNGDKNNLLRKYYISDEVVNQLQYLCTNVVKDRLRRDGFIRKISVVTGPTNYHPLSSSNTSKVLLIINRMSMELQKMHPRTFVSTNIVFDSGAPLILESIAKNLFRSNEITWGSIISFMTITATIASDCARFGQPELVQSVSDTSISLLIDEVGNWIEKQGGFDVLIEYIRPIGSEHVTFVGWLTFLVIFLLTIHWITTMFGAISKQFSKIL